jgi:hypothetical protein
MGTDDTETGYTDPSTTSMTDDSSDTGDGDTSTGDGSTGDGDGDGSTGDGDGSTGDGDGDGSTGDGDGTTGDGDGDGDGTTGDGDGDGEPAETCTDGIQNQDETDQDCGGDTCNPCPDGDACIDGDDCVSTSCDTGTCVALGCQSDTECSGLDGECTQGVCNMGTGDCEASPVNEAGSCDSGDLCAPGACASGACVGTATDCSSFADTCNSASCNQNNGMCETSPANEAGSCDSGDLCAPGACSSGSCVGVVSDCSGLDDDCNSGSCNPGNGMCEATPANEGVACDDADSCTSGTTCTAGACSGGTGTATYTEDFSDNSAGWTLGTEWAIGSTGAGCSDPATDHTATADNGVAGVVLNGCASTVVHADYCLTSPALNTSGMTGTVVLNFWRWLNSDYDPYMINKIEVYNGSTWTNIWQSGLSSTSDFAWTNVQHDVTAYKAANFQARWCMNVGSIGVFSVGSWNIDDVYLGPPACLP